MIDWPLISIEQLAAQSRSALATGPFGSAIGADTFRVNGTPVIRGGNLSADVGIRLDENNLVFIDEELASSFERSSVKIGDLIFTCWGTINQVGLIDSRATYKKYIVSNKQMKLSVDTSKIDPLFLYYFFSSPTGQDEINSRAIGSSVPGFNLTQLRLISVPTPPIRYQQSILSVLTALDDKIELNRRTNETLEAMAQAIFRDWFIDFGPVRRKQAGATNAVEIMGGLTVDAAQAAELAALFPEGLDIEGLPTGWKSGKVEQFFDLAYGKSLPKTERTDGPIPVYGSGGVTGTHNIPLVEGPGIIVGRKGTVGSLYWEPGAYFPIDTVFYVVPKRGTSLEYIWHLLKTLGLEQMNTDAAVPGLNRANVYRLEVTLPIQKITTAFSNIAAKLRSLQSARRAEAVKLTEARDYLLPRLMTGSVRVRAAAESEPSSHGRRALTDALA